MTRILTAHVVVHSDDAESVWLAPGDELPAWAEGKVGDHCLALPEIDTVQGERVFTAADTAKLLADGEALSFVGPKAEDVDAENRMTDDGAPAVAAPADEDETPNFTGAAKAKTPRAPRKKA